MHGNAERQFAEYQISKRRRRDDAEQFRQPECKQFAAFCCFALRQRLWLGIFGRTLRSPSNASVMPQPSRPANLRCFDGLEIGGRGTRQATSRGR